MKEKYKQMCIYDLRNIARKFGVKSPTTKKKALLIDEIIQIRNNNFQPLPKQNRGRKPLHLNKVYNEKYLFENESLKFKFIETLYLALKINNEERKTIKQLLNFLK